ncbi:mucin-3B-like [Spea bombifrons]|uniref:mucin-3B-like n=1 Tax=Spea bombifrons TaxID=233779 RepID=UPI00234BDF1B|nr:mucin-3B-like [Spea bombifrons]
MKMVYGEITGYQDVEIKSVRKGSIIVNHSVIVEAEYTETVTVTEQYNDIVSNVETHLEELIKANCTNGNGSTALCIDSNVKITDDPPKTKEELCFDRFEPGFREFYTPLVTAEGVICLSDCDPQSGRYLSCNGGACMLQNGTGPQCLCPNSEKYIYTGPRCQGKILKSQLYGGVGAAIAVLVVIILVIGFLMFRRKKDKKLDAFTKDQEDVWYDDNNSEWSVECGFTNLSETKEDDEGDSSKSGSFPSKQTFKPALENVDTSIKVKIQRPEISIK